MKRYEVTREIYNPCAGQYVFDFNFVNEVETDNIEETIKSWLTTDFPKFQKELFNNDTIVYTLYLPRLERYTFCEI